MINIINAIDFLQGMIIALNINLIPFWLHLFVTEHIFTLISFPFFTLGGGEMSYAEGEGNVLGGKVSEGGDVQGGDSYTRYTRLPDGHWVTALSRTDPSLFCTLYIINEKSYLTQRGQEWCSKWCFKSNFSLQWLWPLTSWPPKFIVSCPSPEPLVPTALKLVRFQISHSQVW